MIWSSPFRFARRERPLDRVTVLIAVSLSACVNGARVANDSNVSPEFTAAKIDFDRQDYASAIAILENIPATKLTDRRLGNAVRYNLAAAYFNDGQLSAAADVLARARVDGPDLKSRIALESEADVASGRFSVRKH